MSFFSYRYRAVHAVSEKFFEVLSPLIPVVQGRPLVDRPKKILILKFGGVGEAVLARSLVEHLRRRNPSMSFDFLVEARTAETMICGGQSDVLIYHPKTDGLKCALTMLQQIRKRRYDAIIDFEQTSVLTAAFARITSIPIRLGFTPPEPGPRDRMFTHPIPLREGESMWSFFIKAGRILDPDLSTDLMTVPLPCSAQTESWVDEWWNKMIKNTEGPMVAMHLGVGPSAQYRRWPLERFLELGAVLRSFQKKLTVILTGGESEKPLIHQFRSQFGNQTVDASALGGIQCTASMLRRCDLLVSCDTGIMHLGAAMTTPTVGLFGPNTPKCWAPVGPHATWVYTTRRSCSPCINSYRRRIPEKCVSPHDGGCMWDISANDVLEAARKVIRGSWLG